MAAYKLIKGGADDDDSAVAAYEPKKRQGLGAVAGDGLKDDLETGGPASSTATEPSAASANPAPRLVSLDVFRGVTVALMIFVDNAGSLFPGINHSPWDGITLADFVMPLFLFIVGMALALTYKRVTNKTTATKKAILRALKLFIVGVIVQGGYFHGLHNLDYGVDILKIRWMGVLQRIAIAYLLAALCEIWLRSEVDVDSEYSLVRRYRKQLLVGLILATVYIALLYGLYVPDWEYQIPITGSLPKTLSVKCGVRGDTGPACNAVGMIDRQIFGIQHLHRRPVYERTKQCSINSPASGPLPPDAPSWCQAPFDPEGLLSTVMAIVTCLIGLQFGHAIVHFKDHKDRILHWMIASFCLLALAFSLDFFGIHINKALYTISYTCITAGAAGVMFTVVYVLVDVIGYRKPTLAMEWLGMHALMVYVLLGCNLLPVFIQGLYWREPQNNLVIEGYRYFVNVHNRKRKTLVFVATFLMGIMIRRLTFISNKELQVHC